MKRALFAVVAVVVAAGSASVLAQRGRGPALGVVRQPLDDGPFVSDTAE